MAQQVRMSFAKPGYQSSVPETHVVEVENQLLKTLLWTPLIGTQAKAIN